MTVRLALRGASYRYPGAVNESLREVSLELAAGTRTAVLGASGAGLSTLCLVLAGLAPRVVRGELRGSLRIDGEDAQGWPMYRVCERVTLGLPEGGSQLSLVAETVLEEVAFGPANLGLEREEVLARAAGALEQLAISDLAVRDPRLLSGGQQQLVALAGLLAMRPAALILDDPLTQLDARATLAVRSALRAAEAGGTAVLTTSHDADRAVPGSEQLIVLADGRVQRQGTADEVLWEPFAWTAGMVEPSEQRLARLVAEAGSAGGISAISVGGDAADEQPVSLPAWAEDEGPVEMESQDLYFAYPGGPAVLEGIDLVIPAGQAIAVMGANGSGKTTLARHLDGLLRPSSGRVLLDGRDIARRRVAEIASQVAVAFQDPGRQIFARRVQDEVAFGPRQLGFGGKRLAASVSGALAAVGLADAAERHPQDLGETGRKMLAIAALLAMQTPVLVLDEPTAGLDAAARQRLRRILESLRAAGRTVVLVSHDQRFVAETAQRVVVLDQGRIVLEGPPGDVFAEPHWPTLRTAGLEPPTAALLGARLGLGSTPTEATLLAALRAQAPYPSRNQHAT